MTGWEIIRWVSRTRSSLAGFQSFGSIRWISEFPGRVEVSWIYWMNRKLLTSSDYMATSEFKGRTVQLWIHLLSCEALKSIRLSVKFCISYSQGVSSYHLRPFNISIRPGIKEVMLRGFRWSGLRSLSLTSLYSEPCKAIPTGPLHETESLLGTGLLVLSLLSLTHFL